MWTWSPTPRPFGEIGEGSVAFSADRATFIRKVHDVETKLEVTVTAGDAELRRVTINNRSLRTRYIELSSYLELGAGSARIRYGTSCFFQALRTRLRRSAMS